MSCVVDVAFVVVKVVRLLRLRLKRRLSLDSSILAAPPASRVRLLRTLNTRPDVRCRRLRTLNIRPNGRKRGIGRGY